MFCKIWLRPGPKIPACVHNTTDELGWGWGLGSRISGLLGGSGVVISGVISPLIWVMVLITLLITTHEPPSSTI